MLIPIRITTALVALFFVAWAQQTSEDLRNPHDPCKDPLSQMQMNLCSAQQYHQADEQLNQLYLKITKEMQADLQKLGEDLKPWNKKRLEKLQAAERIWLSYRDLHCEAARYEYEGGTIAPAIWAECMRSVTEDRTKELKNTYEPDGGTR